MLQIIKQLCGDKLAASDGHIGHVKDLYFDDKSWAVRYLVVDTGSWMPGRLVLISPHAFGGVIEGGKALSVNLTREQIEKSPSTESHKPISRQYEEEYFRYYGWPSYWQGSAVWGMSAFPGALWDTGAMSVAPQPELLQSEPSPENAAKNAEDIHLRSAEAVVGYAIAATDGMIGHVKDFMMDEKSWEIRQLVVETGHWFAGKKVLVATGEVESISYEEFKIAVLLTQDAIRQASAGAEI